MAGWFRRPRWGRDVPSEDVSVTLSVVERRTAVIVLEVERDAPAPVLSRLVNRAVRDAFAFDAVEIVEIRDRDGELVYWRRREDSRRDRRRAASVLASRRRH